MAVRRSGLGRGLESLIPREDRDTKFEQSNKGIEEEKGEGIYREVSTTSISPNRFQPRSEFDLTDVGSLAASVKEVGILQPLIVRESEEGEYELIAGERRFRAAKAAGLKSVPVIVRSVQDEESLQHAIVENLHRVDLNPIDEAVGYKQLIDEFGFSQEVVAEKVGKSRSSVANLLRLLTLSDPIKAALASGKITEGHGRALLASDDDQVRELMLGRIIDEDLTVRDVERLLKTERPEVKETARQPQSKIVPEFADLCNQLSDRFGTSVKVDSSGKSKKLVIFFADEDDLSRIVKEMSVVKKRR